MPLKHWIVRSSRKMQTEAVLLEIADLRAGAGSPSPSLNPSLQKPVRTLSLMGGSLCPNSAHGARRPLSTSRLLKFSSGWKAHTPLRDRCEADRDLHMIRIAVTVELRGVSHGR